ncbi:S-adenosyl-L-methionine-dependent methyltransferase [Mycena sanguinolenta]|nr:S-adenosyl-L-methionine-dependent methyltransferase [Mycena sanguinolenta]
MEAGVVSYPGLPPGFDSERLDEMHNKLSQYFGNKLGPAPFDSLRPKKILDLGCGSGAWLASKALHVGSTKAQEIIYRAIQAAAQFPEAEVVAVDQSPLPNRSLPPNITFQLADLTQKLDFQDEMFDIVHSRWVMSRVSALVRTLSLKLRSDTKLVDGADILKRVSRLVKPGGLLLIADTDLVSLAESGGPATRRILYKFKEIQNGLGADTEFGKKIAAIITSLGHFSDIQVKKVSIPFGANGSDEALNQFGLGMRKSTIEFLETLPQRMQEHGITHELVLEFTEEQEREWLDDSELRMTSGTWPRLRRVSDVVGRTQWFRLLKSSMRSEPIANSRGIHPILSTTK